MKTFSILLSSLLLSAFTGLKAQVVNQDSFEGSNLADFWYENSVPSRAALSNLYAREGSKSIKFFWQQSYYDGNNGSKHAEIEGIYPSMSNRESWYGWSMYFPSTEDGAQVNRNDAESMIHTQWHLRGGGTHPPVTFSGSDGNWGFSYKWGTVNTDEQSAGVSFGARPLDKWVDLVVHVKWSTNGTAKDGLIELWKDGQRLLSKNNVAVGFGDSGGKGWPYFKIGIYHYTGKANGRKVIHYDAVRHGYASASYADVAPRGGTANSAPVASFTATPPTGPAPLVVHFDATASRDPGGSIATYGWSFGDGTTASGATATHTYATAGTYVATLTVTDNVGATGSADKTIAVTPASDFLIEERFNASPAPFTTAGGTWSVTGGKYALTNPVNGTEANGNGNVAVHNTVIPGNFKLTAQGSATASDGSFDDFSVLFNYQDNNNYYYASFNESNDGATNGIFKKAAGVVTQLADFTALSTAGTTHAVTIEKTGSTLRVSQGTSVLATATDATFAGGKVGFGSRNNGATFDDLVVGPGTGGVATLRKEAPPQAPSHLPREATNPYPNPTSGRITLDLDAEWLGADLTVISASGKPILTRKYAGKEAALDLSGQPGGTYVVTARKGKRAWQRQIVLTK